MSILDATIAIESGAELDFDVCIAGAGAAGITLALELEGSPLRVGLLEAGDAQSPPVDYQHPYRGETVGRPYSLLATRLRYFGGSTNHWGGWCRPLDQVDFSRRSFVPLSGWPFQRPLLDPYYRRAAEICEIHPASFEVPPPVPASPPYFDDHDADFESKIFRVSPPTRFGTRYRPTLQSSGNVTGILNATVVEIEKPGPLAVRLRARTGSKEFFVRARSFVLAMGAIENARLLLDSNRLDERGLGNESDFVGRCFADHPSLDLGLALTLKNAPYVWPAAHSDAVIPHLSCRASVQREHEVVNFGALFLNTSRRADLLMRDHLVDSQLFPRSPTGAPLQADAFTLFKVGVRFEPTPNPDSRVTLIRETDQNGMRRVRLDWRFNNVEFESLGRIARLLARKLGAANLGRFQRTFFDEPEVRQRSVYQSHHMGTTRMSDDPKVGVVDANCQVHSIPNVFIAGSSVFPTFGFANPTLTIVALAVRLAEHLKRAHDGGEARGRSLP